jgi:hypothetical protein
MWWGGTAVAAKRRRVPAADRLAVARLLADRGPLYGGDAADALGWAADRWWAVVGGSDEWFALTGKGWTLTDAGREAVESTPRPPSPEDG